MSLKTTLATSTVTIFLAIVFISTPAHGSVSSETLAASEDAEIEAQFEAEMKKMKEYVVTDDQGVTFDTPAALDDGVSREVLNMGQLLNDYNGEHEAAADDSQMSARGYPVWGNWCGPGYGGGRAVDVLDSICRVHDRCYERVAYFACSCDSYLVSSINRESARMDSRERAVAGAVSAWFQFSKCWPS